MVKQSRNFAVRLYCDDNSLVHSLACQCNHYAYILHDQDTYKDDTEDHAIGDKKKPHFHLLLNFKKNQTVNTVRALVRKFIPHAGEMVEFLNSAKGGFSYLTHDTDQAKKDLKHHYDNSLIISDKPTFWGEEAQKQIKEDKIDWTVEVYDRLSDGSPIGISEYSKFVHKYGRDFILNYKRVHEFVEFIHTVGDHNA